MIPGMESPFSGVGNLRSEIETKLLNKADKYEIETLKNEINSLRNQIERLQNQVSGLMSREGNC
jgi:chaperonin cofactor prefoldin